jgi:quercetin dioxygenase-like cupin family protein
MAVLIPAEEVGVIVPHEITGGDVSVIRQAMAPRHLIRKHIHLRTDVLIYVVAGEVGVRVADEEVTGGPGQFLWKPKGVPHAMWNPGDEPNELLEILTPGDGDVFFRVVRDLPEDTTREEFEAFALEHGIQMFDDWTAELGERYGVSSRR